MYYKNKKQSGFTLLELVVVIGALGVIGITISTILVNTLRGSSKATVLTSVRTSGQYALEQMTRSIRYGTVLTSPTLPCPVTPPASPPTSISFTASDGTPTSYTCTGGTINNQNGQSLLDTTTVKINTTCNFTCTQADVNSSPVITINFDLVQQLPTPTTTLVERTVSPVSFQTSVVMQNIHR